MICPFATYLPVGNHGGPMGQVLGLAMHVQVGTGSLHSYFDNPSSQVSAHFWSAKDGRLEQYLDTGLMSWAQAAGNPNYLSVETEGLPGEPLTQAQLDSLAHLLLWSATVHHFPIVGPVEHGQSGFTPHCHPNAQADPAWGNHPCPGPIRLGQMPAIIWLAATPPAPVSAPTGEPMIAPTPSGNGYWLCSASGAIVTRGDAQYLGGPNTSQVNGQWGGPPNLQAGHVCVSIAAHPSAQGYWVEDDHGLVYAYGAAGWHGNAQ